MRLETLNGVKEQHAITLAEPMHFNRVAPRFLREHDGPPAETINRQSEFRLHSGIFVGRGP